MKSDMHVHTNISDGSCTFEEIIELAKEAALTHIGITNHDTVEKIESMIEIGKNNSMNVIPGIEISAYDFNSKKKVHVLGYCYELEAKNIREICDPILKKRNENSLWQLERIIEMGYNINLDRLKKKTIASKVLYKQHIMEELVESGYTDKIYSDLYKKLFKNDAICARDIEYVDVKDAIKAIKKDKGIAILAHPKQGDLFGLIEELANIGLDGVEINHPDHSQEDKIRIIEIANKNNLILTGGSDFHGSYGSGEKLGSTISPVDYVRCFVF